MVAGLSTLFGRPALILKNRKKNKSANTGAAGQEAGRGWRLRLVACVAVLGLSLVAWLGWNALPRRFLVPASSAADLRTLGRPGPWGKLSWVEVDLRAPERCVAGQCRTNLTQWCVHAASLEQLGAML